MKRALVLAAALLVLLSNGWVVVSALRNRAVDAGGTVELTERELRLPPLFGDSTAMLLDLAWRCRLDEAAWWHPEWLTVSKLEELGFDCSMPASSPHASEHYSAMQSIPVYVLLEFEGATWEKGHRPDDNGTRLIAIDAGRDPGRLRAKHPDKARCIMAHGLIRPFLLRKSDKPGEGPTQPPRIAGRIQAILPGQLFVPKPWNQVLQELRPRDFSEREALRHPPRYAVTVSWGADHLPWLRNVRLLPAPPPKSP